MDYIVVGLQEEYENTVKVMQKMLPHFMPTSKKRNLGNIRLCQRLASKFRSSKNSSFFLGKIYANEGDYPRLTQEARAILRRNLSLEYEFYDFIRERFQALKRLVL